MFPIFESFILHVYRASDFILVANEDLFEQTRLEYDFRILLAELPNFLSSAWICWRPVKTLFK